MDGEVRLVGKGGIPAFLTHWAFGQLAQRVGAPANYLRELPSDLAVSNLNHGLMVRAKAQQPNVSMLFHMNGDKLLVRALTSDRYERIWNWEVAERLLSMQERGWEPARPDIRKIDDRLPLYASDHDLFAFIRSKDRVIKEAGNSMGLYRGFIAENSEVGAGKLRLMRFLYREMCGNHIIWGAQDVVEVALRHVGKIRDKMSMWDTQVRKYMDQSASEDEAKIAWAQRKQIAATKENLLDTLFGMKSLNLTRKALEAGYDANIPDEDGSPMTVWGMVNGLTRFSQTIPYADERTRIDRTAAKILEAF